MRLPTEPATSIFRWRRGPTTGSSLGNLRTRSNPMTMPSDGAKKTRAISHCGRRGKRRNLPPHRGIRPGDPADQAGTSSVRRWRHVILGTRLTFTVEDWISGSHTTKTNSHSLARRVIPLRRPGCTTDSSRWAVTRCPNRSATSCSHQSYSVRQIPRPHDTSF